MKTNDHIILKDNPPLFNLDELNKIGKNDEEFIKVMLTEFNRAAKDCDESLKANLESGDWTKIRGVAHKYIISYSILGIEELADDLKYIEANALKRDEQHSITKIINFFTVRNNEVMEAINDHLKLINQEKTKENIYY